MAIRARIAVFVKPDAAVTDLGIVEFQAIPAEGDNIALPNQPVLKVNWRKFTPTVADQDLVIGCSYYELDRDPSAARDAESSALQEAKKVNEILNSNKALIIDMQSRTFDKASSYANVIIVAGYAAIFTIWTNTRPILSVPENSAVSFLLMLSFSSFVVFEVVKMIITSFSFRRNAIAASKDPERNDYLANMVAAEQISQQKIARFIRFWPVSLFIAIVPAILITGFLFYKFAWLIISVKPSP